MCIHENSPWARRPAPALGAACPLTRLGELECALAPLGQAHNGHHLGAEAAAPLLGRGGPGPAPCLLGSTDFTADAGAPDHIPGACGRGRTRLPVKHGPRGGRASGNSVGEIKRQRGPPSDLGATLPQPPLLSCVILGKSLGLSEVVRIQECAESGSIHGSILVSTWLPWQMTGFAVKAEAVESNGPLLNSKGLYALAV